ncbi:hypothetical protein OED52_05445 [Rhodococcus sp. Z13]|uniref:Uncharacterized protein n=1 Tax=Rhodococcus sacchari TaxID=2962047 RepID=A0ACD4DIU7_9NOCA|nr:hypothetical protein [Rhodococcus sp. Z13]UYP19995.1 hypothetical protein OED52_05445 [Rhodococcus sp. Z13]
MTTAAPAMTPTAPAVPAATVGRPAVAKPVSPARPADDPPPLLEHPLAGAVILLVLMVLGCVAATALTGSIGTGLAFAGMIGGATALLVALI